MEFKLDDVELANAKKFKETHDRIPGTNENTYSYLFTPTDKGMRVKIIHNKCNCIKDITNIDNW